MEDGLRYDVGRSRADARPGREVGLRPPPGLFTFRAVLASSGSLGPKTETSPTSFPTSHSTSQPGMRTRLLQLSAAAAALAALAAVLAPGAAPEATALPSADAAAQDTGPLTPAQVDQLPPAQRAVRLHQRADRGPEQPIPFSHRFHVTELRMGCDYCHGGADRSRVAPMPSVSTCLGCHRIVGSGLAAIDTLRAYANREEPIPWKRIYKVPEFVQFKHRPHLRTGVECQECHGPVEEMDRVYKFSDLSMGWCLSCHRGEPQPTDVATTSQLVREFPPPETPEGRQPAGLYPRAISSGYGAYRAPDDCAACHY